MKFKRNNLGKLHLIIDNAFVLLLIILALSNCKKDEVKKDEKVDKKEDIILYSSKIQNINSAVLKNNNKILIFSGYGCFTLLDTNLNIAHQNIFEISSYNVYHPFSEIDVLMNHGDYASAPYSPIGAYISSDTCQTFHNDFTFKPKWGDYWFGYLPISLNEYMLFGGSNWEKSIIVFIKDGIQNSNFMEVLEGYSILQGFYDNGTIQIIANKVSNNQPSYDENIYYFYSTDMGKTWLGKYSFGLIGYTNLIFKKIDSGTIVLYNSTLNQEFISYDNGNSWNENTFSITFTDVFYLNKSLRLGIYNNQLYESVDAGNSWHIKNNLKFKAAKLYFKDTSIGIVYSDTLIGYTSNGGVNWKYIIEKKPY